MNRGPGHEHFPSGLHAPPLAVEEDLNVAGDAGLLILRVSSQDQHALVPLDGGVEFAVEKTKIAHVPHVWGHEEHWCC